MKKIHWLTLVLVFIAVVGVISIDQNSSFEGGYPPLPQKESLPSNYYEVAENYVAENYGFVDEKNIENLVNFLNQVQLREYKENVFDCSEATAMLEWLLEGAGFDADIAYVYFPAHVWVLVRLSGSDVAIDSSYLCEGYDYHPPGIIEAPDGSYREYTYAYEEYLSDNWWFEGSFEEWREEYWILIPPPPDYYDPPEVYHTLTDAISPWPGGGLPKSEWDWWNVAPYNNMTPFSEWD